VEGIGTFVLVLTVLAVALNPETRRWAALAIGGALGFLVMVLGPLTGGSFNPARWFGPALVGNHFTDAWVYIFGPIVGALVAAAVYKFIIEPSSGPLQEAVDTVAPRGPAPTAGEAPPLRQERPPSSPPGGIAGS
jgi:Major intrinsic protein